ncbi:MAG: hypothetical protein ABS81_10350 [Pseudonocardia sp. SCN 72-86]|nr:MAG: hypothetical protein ABS81_10350 [Pseudonocardia sp. SCN 72-86]
MDARRRFDNATRYGPVATIWTRDVTTAHTLAADVRGEVWVNGGAALDPALPWSGILADTEEKVVTIVL